MLGEGTSDFFSGSAHWRQRTSHGIYIYMLHTWTFKSGCQLHPKGWRIDTLFWNHARHPYWRVAGTYDNIWVFPKIGVPQNGWFIMENPLFKWMIWGYHYFRKHPYSRYMEPKWPYRPFCLEFGVSALGLGGSQTGSRDMGDRCIMAGGGPLFATPTWEWQGC